MTALHAAAVLCATEEWRVACVGDSITRGDATHEPGDGLHAPLKAQITDRGNYPAALQRLLGENWRVRNFGRGGCSVLNTTGKPCTDYAPLRDAIGWGPHVVVLMVGTNYAKRPRAEVIDHFGAGLQQLASRFLQLPSRPSLVLLVPPPIVHDIGGINLQTLRDVVAPRVTSVSAALQRERRRSAPCDHGAVQLLDLRRHGIAWHGMAWHSIA